MKRSYVLLVALLFVWVHIKAQKSDSPSIEKRRTESIVPTPNKIAQELLKKLEKERFYPYQVLQLNRKIEKHAYRQLVSKAIFLELAQDSLQRMKQEQPDNIMFYIPTSESDMLELALTKVNIKADDYRVLTETGEHHENADNLFYRGIVKDGTNSVVALSIFKNEVRLMLSDARGNYVLGNLREKGVADYVFYNDQDLKIQHDFACETPDMPLPKLEHETLSHLQKSNSNNCIKVYIEATFEFYQDKGSVGNTRDFIEGLFHEVATIYSNESINTTISEIKVWTSNDPYNEGNSVTALQSFRSNIGSSFNGDIAHLLSTASNGNGGIATVDALCFKSVAHAYSNIRSTFNTFPTYSWTVSVFTHEMGHNLGSNHTHACVWNGNNTQIDDCGNVATVTPNAPCYNPGNPIIPSNGGTVMSYCHVNSAGINLSLGFGDQPGNLIRNRIARAASNGCISDDCAGGDDGDECSNTAPTASQLSTTNISTNTARLNNSQNNIDATAWRYRRAGTSSWIPIGANASNSQSISNLEANTSYEWQAQAVCDGIGGNWSATETFTTDTDGNACDNTPPAASQLFASNITFTSATLNNDKQEVDATDWRYRRQGFSNWISAGTTTAVTKNINNLMSGVRYEWQAQVICDGIGGGWSAIESFITEEEMNCTTTTPNVSQLYTTNIGFTSATLNNSKTDIESTNWRYRKEGASNWISGGSTPNGSKNIGNLTSNTRYQWQAQVTCAGATSSWSATETFTTANDCSTTTPSASQLWTDNIANNSAQLNNSRTNLDRTNWRYRREGTSGWTNAGSSANGRQTISNLQANTRYQWQAQAVCGNGSGNWSATESFTTTGSTNNCSPEAPATTQLYVTEITGNSARLNSRRSDVDKTNWRYRKQGASNWINTGSTTAIYKVIGNLQNNTTYQWQAQSICGNTAGEWSWTMTFSTNTSGSNCSTAPPTASQLNVSDISTNSAKLTSSKTNVDKTNWRFRKEGAANWTNAGATTNQVKTIGNLQANTRYQWQAQSLCGNDSGNWSWTETFTTAGNSCSTSPPTGAQLSTSEIGTNSAKLISSKTNVDKTNWRFRKEGTQNWTNAGATTNGSKIIGNLQSNTTYQWQAQAICGNDSGNWSWTETFTTAGNSCSTSPPTAAQLTTSEIGTNSAKLNSSKTNVTKTNWRFRKEGTANWTNAGSTTGQMKMIGSLQPNTRYQWQAQAICGNESGNWSWTETFTTAGNSCSASPPTAAQLTTSEIGTNSAKLNSSKTNVDKTNWRFRKEGAANWTNAGSTTNGSKIIGNLQPNTRYQWQAQAVCGNESGSWSWTESFTTAGNNCSTNPPTAAQLTTSEIGTNSAKLNSSKTNVDKTNWRFRKEGTTNWTNAGATTNRVKTIGNLQANTTYQWQAQAICGNEGGNWSWTESFTTAGSGNNCSTAPPTTAQLSTTSITNSAATLNSNKVNVDKTNWRFRKEGTTNWTNAGSTTSRMKVIGSLQANTRYQWQAQAICGNDSGNWSATKTFTTTGSSGGGNCACTNHFANTICDDFDRYDEGAIGPQSSCWTTWTGNEGGAEDGLIEKRDGNQYLVIRGTDPNGGLQDVVLKLGNRADGIYELRFDMWMWSGNKGYFNLLHIFNGSAGNNEWAQEVFFNGNGSGILEVGGQNHSFRYGQNKWLDVRQSFNINDNSASLYIDNVLVHTWPFNYQTRTTSGTKRLAALDFYPLDTDYLFFIDNVEFNKVSSLSDSSIEGRSVPPPPTGAAIVPSTEAMTLHIFPNPNNGRFKLDIQAPTATAMQIEVLDALGQLITKHEVQATESVEHHFDLSNREKGVYIVRVLSEAGVLTKQVVLAR